MDNVLTENCKGTARLDSFSVTKYLHYIAFIIAVTRQTLMKAMKQGRQKHRQTSSDRQ